MTDPVPHLREAYDGLDGVHDALQEAKRAYGGPCPCGPPALSEALESVQDAELKLERVLYGEDATNL